MAGNLTAMIAAIFSGGVTPDPYYEYTTLLLPGNGTNGAQNNTFLDGSTNNFTITRNGNTTQGTFSPFSQTGWGNYFNGSNAGLSVNVSGIAAGSSTFTLEMWVYLIAYPSTDAPFVDTRSSNGVTTTAFQFGVYSTGAIKFYDGTETNLGGTIPRNQWTHIALVRNSSNVVTPYINGTATGTTVSCTRNLSDNYFWICSVPSPSSPYLNAYVSNLRWVVGSAVYTSNFTPSTSPLTAITNTVLLTCQSNRFIDTNTQVAAKTITVNGSPTVVAFSPFNPTASWSAATYGGSGYFDGSGDYLNLTIGSTTIGSGDFTIELWYYPITFENYDTLFSTTRGANGFNIGTNASKSLVWYSSSAEQINAGSLVQYAWNHIAFTRTSNSLRAYINGSQVGATPTVSTNFSAANCWVGDLSAIGGEPSHGYISGLRVVTQSLSSGATYTVPTAPPTAITNTSLLLNFTNAGIYDATSKNDLETVGNAQISTTQSKWGGSSMYFDGTGDWLLIPDQPPQRIGTGNFTVEMWVYRNSSGTYGLAGKGTGTTGWLVSLNSSNQVVFTYGSSTITSSGTVSATTWTHIAVVREGTSTNQTKIYISGTNDGTGTVSTDFNQTNSMYIGADRTGGSAANAYVQDVRITNYARYTGNFTPPTAAFPTL